jgi:hypothetical protein
MRGISSNVIVGKIAFDEWAAASAWCCGEMRAAQEAKRDIASTGKTSSHDCDASSAKKNNKRQMTSNRAVSGVQSSE